MDELKKFAEMIKHLQHTYACGEWHFTHMGRTYYTVHTATIKTLGADLVYDTLQRFKQKRAVSRFDCLELA